MSTTNGHARRDFDLVFFGATGFTGRLVAEYLVERKAAVRWALAGRSLAKLEAVRAALAARDAAAASLPLVVVDGPISDVARRTRVVCTTVGPFARYGSPLVAACAEHGTDYCDITGEVQWIRAMIDAHHAGAEASGARIVPCCGFDSIPSDLGVWLAWKHFEAQGKKLARVRFRLRHASGGVSGGTAASMLNLLEEAKDPAVRRVIGNPYALSPGERGPDGQDATLPARDPDTGRWTAPFVMAAINTRVVRRSNSLLGHAYGEGFRYDETIDTGRGATGAAIAWGTILGLGAFVALASTGAGRSLARRVLPAPGEGPSREARERGSFRVELRATATDGSAATVTVEGRRDPGYGETAKMLGESALCLAEDDLPRRGGLLTPASSMGERLVERLRASGMTFSVG